MSRVPKYVLLSDWDNFSLGDICKLRSENYEPKKNGTLKYIGLEHIESGIPIITNFGFETDVKSAKHRFYPIDILYGKLRPYLDKVVLSNIEGISSSDILILKAEETKVLPNYLIKLLHHNRFLKYATSTMTGTTLPRTNWKALSKFVIFLPKIAEQKKIVSILENVDNIIQSTQRLIEKLQECKKGLMQRLFTEGIGHTEFKDTKLGRIPKEWQVVKIKEVGKVITGKTPSTKNPKFWGEGYPFITPTDLKDTVYFGNYERTVTPKGASKGNLIPKNSVLVTCIASIGKSALVRKKCITNQQINSIICNEGINPKYIYYTIQYRKRYLELYANIAVVPIINKTLFELFKIPLPKKKEQDKIASIVFNLDNQIEIERKYIKELKIIKKGLMQVLLTGKKRVPQ